MITPEAFEAVKIEMEKMRDQIGDLQRRLAERCTHNYADKGLMVATLKEVTNGVEVQVPNVPFGARVAVQTNQAWKVKVCEKCGSWQVILPKDAPRIVT